MRLDKNNKYAMAVYVQKVDSRWPYYTLELFSVLPTILLTTLLLIYVNLANVSKSMTNCDCEYICSEHRDRMSNA